MKSKESDNMYVRYIGNKVCWTILNTGAFYIGYPEDLSSEEKKLCDAGGGELPVSDGIRVVCHFEDRNN